jgi:hypothetical protein
MHPLLLGTVASDHRADLTQPPPGRVAARSPCASGAVPAAAT